MFGANDFSLEKKKTYYIGHKHLTYYRFADGLVSFAGPEGHTVGPSEDRHDHKEDWFCKPRLGEKFYTRRKTVAMLSCISERCLKTNREYFENIADNCTKLSIEFSSSVFHAEQFRQMAQDMRALLAGKPVSPLIEELVQRQLRKKNCLSG